MTFDEQLASEGKYRTYKTESFLNSNGNYATVYRQVILPIPKQTKRAAKKAAEVIKPKVKRERAAKGQPTKQQQAVRLVEINPKKEEAIYAIMTQLSMSKAGATTYYYNAKKILGEKQ